MAGGSSAHDTPGSIRACILRRKSSMTPEQSAQLENMLELVRNCHHEALPRLIGTLRELLATAEMRLHTAMPAPAPCTTDEFLTVKQAAARLGCSKDLLYK